MISFVSWLERRGTLQILPTPQIADCAFDAARVTVGLIQSTVGATHLATLGIRGRLGFSYPFSARNTSPSRNHLLAA